MALKSRGIIVSTGLSYVNIMLVNQFNTSIGFSIEIEAGKGKKNSGTLIEIYDFGGILANFYAGKIYSC